MHNRAPVRARGRRNPTKTTGVAAKGRARPEVAAAWRIALLDIVPADGRPLVPAPAKSASGGGALPADWRIPRGSGLVRSVRPRQTQTVPTAGEPLLDRVPAKPTWLRHCNPQRRFRAWLTAGGPGG